MYFNFMLKGSSEKKIGDPGGIGDRKPKCSQGAATSIDRLQTPHAIETFPISGDPGSREKTGGVTLQSEQETPLSESEWTRIAERDAVYPVRSPLHPIHDKARRKQLGPSKRIGQNRKYGFRRRGEPDDPHRIGLAGPAGSRRRDREKENRDHDACGYEPSSRHA